MSSRKQTGLNNAGRQPLPSRFSGFRRRARRGGRRARAPPASAAWSRSRPRAEARAGARDRRAISEMSSARSAPIRTTRTRNSTSTPTTLVALPKHPKVVAIGEAGLDYHYDNSPRDAQAQGFRHHIAAARETGLPLVIHSRDADADMARILEEETGKGAFPAVLHCFTGGRDLALHARSSSGHYVSFTGILTFKNSRRSARHRRRAAGRPHPGRDRCALSRARPYRGKRNEPAYVVETAKVLAAGARRYAGGDRAPDHREFLPPVQQSAAQLGRRRHELDLHHPRLRLFGGRAARRRWAGAPAIRTTRRTAAGAARFWSNAQAPRRRHPRPGRLHRPICASNCSTPTSTGSTACSITHEHADHTHGIDDLRAAVRRTSAAASTSICDEPTSRALHARFGYCFETPPGSEYPPILTEHRLVPGQAGHHRRAGRPDHGAAGAAGPRRYRLARLPLRRRGLFGRHQGLPAESLRRWPGSTSGSSTRCARRRIRATSTSTRRWNGSSGSSPKRAILTNMHTDLDYEALRAQLPPNVEPAYDGMQFEL